MPQDPILTLLLAAAKANPQLNDPVQNQTQANLQALVNPPPPPRQPAISLAMLKANTPYDYNQFQGPPKPPSPWHTFLNSGWNSFGSTPDLNPKNSMTATDAMGQWLGLNQPMSDEELQNPVAAKAGRLSGALGTIALVMNAYRDAMLAGQAVKNAPDLWQGIKATGKAMRPDMHTGGVSGGFTLAQYLQNQDEQQNEQNSVNNALKSTAKDPYVWFPGP